MELRTAIYRVGMIMLLLTSQAGGALAQDHLAEHGPQTGPLTAQPITGAPRSIELQGTPFTKEARAACKYDHFTRGRMSYWFNISWGDGTISNLQSGQDGESCADIGRHTYAKPGTYQIGVYIGTLGNADQPVRLFSGGAEVVISD